jgi:hypothetical protein
MLIVAQGIPKEFIKTARMTSLSSVNPVGESDGFHALAGLDVSDLLAAGEGDACACMAHDQSAAPPHGVVVGRADEAGVQFDKDFAVARATKRDLAEEELAAAIGKAGGRASVHTLFGI